MQKLKTNWLVYSISGLLLTGAGLSMAVEAGLGKAAGDPWFIFGTAALVVFNSGLCLIGQGIIYKCRLERAEVNLMISDK